MPSAHWNKKLVIRDVILIALAILIGGAPVISLHRLVDELLKQFYKNKQSITDKAAIQIFRNALTKLKKDKMIENNVRGSWRITKIGRHKADFLQRYRIYENFKIKNLNKSPDTLIIFDVPELNRKKRDYLRNELVNLGYKPIQKSVWIGHSPLPMEFIDYLNELKLFAYIQIFTIRKFGTL